MSKPFDLSDEYWESLSPKAQALYGLIRPQPKAAYTVDVHLNNMEDFFQKQADELPPMGGTFELEPDFQRGHVWADAQRISYVEAVLRGTAPTRILFNCPGWQRNDAEGGDIRPYTFQCVDGLQRLTSVRKFMAGEFPIFGGLSVEDLKSTPFSLGRFRFQFCVYEFKHRSELLQFYLDLNEGGTVHAQSELDRVRQLREAAMALSVGHDPESTNQHRTRQVV